MKITQLEQKSESQKMRKSIRAEINENRENQ